MKATTATAIFRTDLASTDAKAPDWVELFPAGPELLARDGRKWTSNPSAVIAAFAANNAPLPIDYEHGQDHLAPEGKEAPAAGWIVKVEERAGAVWGQVEWTARAARMIVDREYRFLSPAFHTTKSGEITRLVGAGLVNRPALEMTALSREQPPENQMSKAIAKALGLADDTAEQAILARITTATADRAALCQALKLDAGADQPAILAAIGKLQSDLEAAGNNEKTDLAALRTELAALKQKDIDRSIDAALDEATAEGKITPASRETYRAMCAAEGGLDRFKALARTLPVICAPTALDGRTASTVTPADATDPVALAAKGRKYQDEQQALGHTISISEAVAHVKEQA